MRCCYFRFGDYFFHQEDGTAMGAPPAPSFAMLYYGVHAHFTLLPTFQDNLAYNGRYIENNWICITDPEIDSFRWDSFKEHTGFGKLVCDVSERQQTVNFLDLRISLHPSGRITTRLYKKALNLHLYLSPLSAHPPGLLSGLVHGMPYQIIMLTSDLLDTSEDIQKWFFRLRNRGYPRSQRLPLFRSAYKKIDRCLHSPPPPIDADTKHNTSIFFHVPYNSLDPERGQIQHLAHTCLLEPNGEETLPYLKNFSNGYCEIKRLIVAYHKERNLKNLLFPRRFREITGQPVLSFFPPLDPPTQPQEQPEP
jgi:hypothetical protein